ncbi:hypothetical protein BGX26_002199 [Mortierella sp. AD094]|nr:hypothetical protein BGX26_002199 [Mortierella sp. AD094]
METLRDELLQALNSEEDHQTSKKDLHSALVDKNKDYQCITNQLDCSININNANVCSGDNTPLKLPAEILLNILQDLTVSQLLPCQWVSRQFRTVARTVLMDKIGGDYLHQQYLYSLYRQKNQMRRDSADGLPPSSHHLNTNPQFGHQQDQQHQQPMAGPEQQSQTGLQIQYQSSSNNVQTFSPPSPLQQSLHRDAGYVAPGNIALFLFPCHDHAPTGWQELQAVHFQCTGIDRIKEQLIFAPIYPDTGDCLKFNTNSWGLPSTSTSSSHSGTGGTSRSSNSGTSIPVEASTNSSYKSPATGLDLFDYSTGLPRSGNTASKPMNINEGLGSYSFTDLFNARRRDSGSDGDTSMDMGLRSPSMSSSPPFTLSYLSSSNSSTSSLPSTNSLSSSSLPTFVNQSSPRVTTGGNGGEHYSVIGIKYGDWPEERQMSGRWWGGGLHSSLAQQSMVFLPWAASPGGQGSVVDFQQRQIRKLEENEKQQKEHHGKNRSSLFGEDTTTGGRGGESDESDRSGSDEMGCSRTHRHHMYTTSGQARNPPAHHYRYFCLHHDQLMTDIAAFSSPKANIEKDSGKRDPKRKHLMARAGSKHLSVDYGARVAESNRCQFCLSSPCRANLEIQVKFEEVRVSLDWILSGVSPECNGVLSPPLSSTATATMQPALQREPRQQPAL